MQLSEIILYGAAALACFILAALIKGNRQGVLQLAADLIQKAESAIQGSGLGAEKKALVVAQLESAGIRVGVWLSRQIDIIVAALNSSGAWLAKQTQQGISGLSAGATNKPCDTAEGANE